MISGLKFSTVKLDKHPLDNALLADKANELSKKSWDDLKSIVELKLLQKYGITMQYFGEESLNTYQVPYFWDKSLLNRGEDGAKAAEDMLFLITAFLIGHGQSNDIIQWIAVFIEVFERLPAFVNEDLLERIVGESLKDLSDLSIKPFTSKEEEVLKFIERLVYGSHGKTITNKVFPSKMWSIGTDYSKMNFLLDAFRKLKIKEILGLISKIRRLTRESYVPQYLVEEFFELIKDFSLDNLPKEVESAIQDEQILRDLFLSLLQYKNFALLSRYYRMQKVDIRHRGILIDLLLFEWRKNGFKAFGFDDIENFLATFSNEFLGTAPDKNSRVVYVDGVLEEKVIDFIVKNKASIPLTYFEGNCSKIGGSLGKKVNERLNQ